MNKFKPGDKVVCTIDSDDGSFFGHPGEKFTVSKYEVEQVGTKYESPSVWFEEMPKGEVGVDPRRFELVQTENKFKPGDKAKCIRENLFFGEKDEIYTVSKAYKYGIDFIEMKMGDVIVDMDRFELVQTESAKIESVQVSTEDSDLASLIKTVNAGCRAEHLLLTKYRDQIQRKHIDDDDTQWYTLISNPYSGYCEYREMPKSAFEPFYIGPADSCCDKEYVMDCLDNPDHKPWKVELKDGLLQIHGIGIFNAENLMNSLADLTRDSISGCTVSGIPLDCMRNGIIFNGKYQISWEDAEFVLAVLEGVYSK